MKARSVAVFFAGFAAGVLFLTVLLRQAGTPGVIKAAAASNPLEASHAAPNALPDADGFQREQLSSDAPSSGPRGLLIPVSGVSASTRRTILTRLTTVIAMKRWTSWRRAAHR